MTNGENGPRPRVYGNRELAQTFLYYRILLSRVASNPTFGLDQFSYVLTRDTGCLIAKEIIGSIPHREFHKHLGLN